MDSLIADIIKRNRLEVWLQPVFCVTDGRVFGYEALTRGPEGPLRTPLALFSEARQEGLFAQLDRLCRDNILHKSQECALDGILFVNIDPAAFLVGHNTAEGSLYDMHRFPEPGRVAIEFTAESDLCRFGGFVDPVNRLHTLGYRIACDHTMTDGMSFLSVHDLHPDFLKVGVGGYDGSGTVDYAKVTEVAGLLHAQAIAVGVETPEQMQTLLKSSVKLAQGNFLAPPARKPCSRLNPEAAALLERQPEQPV